MPQSGFLSSRVKFARHLVSAFVVACTKDRSLTDANLVSDASWPTLKCFRAGPGCLLLYLDGSAAHKTHA